MKKLINKIRRRDDEEPSSRITSDTVAEHRERILAGGRKFKYPIQYTRRRLVYVAVIIGVAAIITSVAVGWWQLYQRQSTSDFMYHVTEVLPLPVANVDGEFVSYRDYLMKYRSSVYYLEHKEQVDFKSSDGKRRITYIKQQSMQDAIADTYAAKLAVGLKLSVNDSEIEEFLEGQRQTADGEISVQTYNTVIMDHFGWSPEESRHEIQNKLLRQKVAYAVDTDALKNANDVSNTLKSATNTDFKSLANKIGASVAYGSSGWVPKTNQDGGLALAASKMTVGQVSDVIKSTIGDGYYLIKLININNTQVNYEYIKIPLTTFDLRLKQVQKSGKATEYISISKS